MDFNNWKNEYAADLETILGCLNYSSGDVLPAVFQSLNRVYENLEAEEGTRWKALFSRLKAVLEEKHATSDIFANDEQARKVLHAGQDFIPRYRQRHEDLLYYQEDDFLFNPFSIGQLLQTILSLKTWSLDDPEEAFERTVRKYDDFIGFRPVPVLHSRQKMQPYPREWVHSVPMYLKDVGVVHGPYEKLISRAMEILQETPEDLLREAAFDPNQLAELSIDPRSLDFEHPVNRRLNYLFGNWDPLMITNQGFYSRFVLIYEPFLSIVSRTNPNIIPEVLPGELLEEASSVLVGTMLMGSTVSGWGPGAHDSSDTFAKLLPKVAAIRDEFYKRRLTVLSGRHAQRLHEEEKYLHQPFAGARQYFNQNLSKMRATQYQNVQMARLYAWMGFADASNEMLTGVPVPSVRMRCEIDCLLTRGHIAIDRDRVADAIPMAYRIEDVLHRGIECGALLDPWCILGFGGQYPLSDRIEDSTNDMRVDEMIGMVSSLLSLYSRLWKEAAATGMERECREISIRMQEFARWWDQFGTLDVQTDVKSISGQETYESTEQVVQSLMAWHAAGTAAGDIAFWRPRVLNFSSAKAYVLLIEALLDQHDPVAAMALLVHWLSQSELIPLDDGDYSFHPLSLRWMEDLWYPPTKRERMLCRRGKELQDHWNLAKRFVDSLEANAELYGEVPVLNLNNGKNTEGYRPDVPEESDPTDLYNAAWDDVTYHDTTDDGIDADMVNPDAMNEAINEFPLTQEMERISDRLIFLITQARLWKMAAVFSIPFADAHPDRGEVLQEWCSQARKLQLGLNQLIDEVHHFPIDQPDVSRPVAMMEYEKKLSMKYTLLDRIISTCSELIDAQRLMRIADVKNRIRNVTTWESATACIIQSLVCGDLPRIRQIWNHTTDLLIKEPILFVPLERGGDPHRLLKIRTILMAMERMLVNLPRQGLLAESYRVLEMVQEMEREHPTGARAITRYDHLFDLGNKGIIRSILRSASGQKRRKWGMRSLIPALSSMMEILAENWVLHSRGIRVSTMDSFQDQREWKALVHFVQTYGKDLLSPINMGYGTLQAIHHQGTRNWLVSLMNDDEPEFGESLAEDLRNNRIPLNKAAYLLDGILESLMEHYGQFIDYNTTTTQSDNGENLYILLDFLRLMAEYDRMAWDIRPFHTTHSVMVREKYYDVADSWSESIAVRTHEVADVLQKRYDRLAQKYGVRVKSIYDRFQERFVKPMLINKLCALLEPSIQESREEVPERPMFTQFQELAQVFLKETAGTGFEPPRWLSELEDEVQHFRNRSEDDDEMLDLSDYIPERLLTLAEIKAVITDLKMDRRTLPFQVSKMDFSADMPDDLRKIAESLIQHVEEQGLFESDDLQDEEDFPDITDTPETPDVNEDNDQKTHDW